MKSRLVFEAGGSAGIRLDLGASDLTLGRAPDCDFVFESHDDIVSGHHATLLYRDGRYVLRDDGSTNGTFVNNRRVEEQELRDGDVVEFGLGGPTARFVGEERRPSALATGGRGGTVTRLLRVAKEQAGDSGSRTIVMKEFVRLAYRQSARRTRRIAASVALLAIALVCGVWWVGEQERLKAEAQLQELGTQLYRERSSRQALAGELSRVQGDYTQLRDEYGELRGEHGSLRERYNRLEQDQAEQLARIERDGRFGEAITREYSRGVAFLVFRWGFAERDSDRFIRAMTDGQGGVLWTTDARGDTVPELTVGGDGPIYPGSGGSGTGFLVDGEGWLVTNRHIVEPWNYGDYDLASLRDRGFEPRFYELLAFFPTRIEPYRASVANVSDDADVALLRLDAPVDAPVLPLADGDRPVRAGQPVVAVGYPTGLRNMLQRLDPTEAERILGQAESSGGSESAIASLLARRGLIYPVVSMGNVSETSPLDVSYTAMSTHGSSGGPVFGVDGEVVAVHYRSDAGLDPAGRFLPRRGAPIRHARALLPPELRRRPAP